MTPEISRYEMADQAREAIFKIMMAWPGREYATYTTVKAVDTFSSRGDSQHITNRLSFLDLSETKAGIVSVRFSQHVSGFRLIDDMEMVWANAHPHSPGLFSRAHDPAEVRATEAEFMTGKYKSIRLEDQDTHLRTTGDGRRGAQWTLNPETFGDRPLTPAFVVLAYTAVLADRILSTRQTMAS